MQENNNKINLENLDHYLSSMGFLYPINEQQLEIFDFLFADFDFKLKNAKIDFASIIKNQLSKKSILHIIDDVNINEMNELKMAARKGNEGLSQDIIDKMYSKHRKKSDDKE